MAVTQGKIIESLEAICGSLDKDEFIYQFLLAYGFPKATITRLKDGSRNVASNGDVALKKQLYFRTLASGTNVYEAAEALKSEPVVKSNDIRFIVVTDFDSLVAFDLKAEESLDTDINLLDKQYAFFLPLAGYEKAIMYSEHPADIKASEKMGQLFDLIRERNDLSKPEDIHALNVFLTRLLFCFYAEDTGIFEQDQMTKAIESTTSITGEDLDQFFTDLFKALNLPDTAPEKQAMPAHLQAFPYVNGGLFKADEPVPEFGTKARRLLLECGSLSWAEINPDIFGSMFQAVIDQEQRGNLGQHYTSVSNIMKVIKPLFLDKLRDALEAAKGKEKKLKELLIRLQNIRVFDPACGSGNFLIIAYKELRKIEMAVIDELNLVSVQSEMYYSGIKLSQFYGIEIDDFAHEIAMLSLWLAEHQMNVEFREQFGYSEAALPLSNPGNITCGNSLSLDWNSVCDISRSDETYVCGNPPFHGNKGRTEQHVEDMENVLGEINGYGRLDFVACWFLLASKFAEDRHVECAFVATNSLCQGEQVALIWPQIFKRNQSIFFAYKTFEWKNQAKGNAGVHVVVIGFGQHVRTKRLFSQSTKGQWTVQNCDRISPYLVPGSELAVTPARKPLTKGISVMENGSEYSNSDPLILSQEEYDQIKGMPEERWVKGLVGSSEFINGKKRYCFWLEDATEEDINKSEIIKDRVARTREIRLSKTNKGVIDSANWPHLFKIPNHPKEGNYILVPRVSSMRRRYIPIGFMDTDVVATNKVQIIPNGSLFEFGILTSEMHMDWMRVVAGRLKSDYSYSASLVYNTFPWPLVNDDQRRNIEVLAEEVLLVREDYPDKTLADLYDPDKMPLPLQTAHQALDAAVEKLYSSKPLTDSSERLEHLFGLYSMLIGKN
ncbi:MULTISPECIES: DNA methyltransferase [unclassified Marinobacterium]|uniref:class I SAM-dependent DNA methyltransferase n=1 Tax=unclassified Marinobacterium TaxID=2644139 RepID=UPI0015687170|nr:MULTISPECIES: DNA methyltransferase [unclassified Marinobacterium]NRP10370.1 hypothetical protein [Marinobacterium sp. xm-g-48]NRP83469.1 hypothetical protein [Marinobacterium sp. xm-d-509]